MRRRAARGHDGRRSSPRVAIDQRHRQRLADERARSRHGPAGAAPSRPRSPRAASARRSSASPAPSTKASGSASGRSAARPRARAPRGSPGRNTAPASARPAALPSPGTCARSARSARRTAAPGAGPAGRSSVKVGVVGNADVAAGEIGRAAPSSASGAPGARDARVIGSTTCALIAHGLEPQHREALGAGQASVGGGEIVSSRPNRAAADSPRRPASASRSSSAARARIQAELDGAVVADEAAAAAISRTRPWSVTNQSDGRRRRRAPRRARRASAASSERPAASWRLSLRADDRPGACKAPRRGPLCQAKPEGARD